jgi:hypothetical protein
MTHLFYLVILTCVCLASGAAAANPDDLPVDQTKPFAGSTFESPRIERLFHKITGAIGSETSRPGWKNVPWYRGGSFFGARWAFGEGARDDAQIAESSGDQRDQLVYDVSTLFFGNRPEKGLAIRAISGTSPSVDDSPTRFFGLNVNTLWVPPGIGWGANVSFSVDGKSVVGSGMHLNFSHYDRADGSPQARLHLGTRLEYRIFDTTVSIDSELDPIADLARHLKTPEALRELGLARLAELEKKVLATLAAHQAETHDDGPYNNDGIPPQQIPRALTPAEEATATTAAQTHFASQTALLQTHSRDLHVAAIKAFPFTAHIQE